MFWSRNTQPRNATEPRNATDAPEEVAAAIRALGSAIDKAGQSARERARASQPQPKNAHEALTDPTYLLASLNSVLEELAVLKLRPVRTSFLSLSQQPPDHHTTARCAQMILYCTTDWKRHFAPLERRLKIVAVHIINVLLDSNVPLARSSSSSQPELAQETSLRLRAYFKEVLHFFANTEEYESCAALPCPDDANLRHRHFSKETAFFLCSFVQSPLQFTNASHKKGAPSVADLAHDLRPYVLVVLYTADLCLLTMTLTLCDMPNTSDALEHLAKLYLEQYSNKLVLRSHLVPSATRLFSAFRQETYSDYPAAALFKQYWLAPQGIHASLLAIRDAVYEITISKARTFSDALQSLALPRRAAFLEATSLNKQYLGDDVLRKILLPHAAILHHPQPLQQW